MSRFASKKAALARTRAGSGPAQPRKSKRDGMFATVVSGLQRLLRRPYAPAAADAETLSVTLRNPWRAVSIVPGKHCCKAVQGLDARYLCSEAPLLPVAGCTNPDGCQCTYRHHEDRRKGPRRHRDGAIRVVTMQPGFPGPDERRRQVGRRITD